MSGFILSIITARIAPLFLIGETGRRLLVLVLGLFMVDSAQAEVTLRAGPPPDCPPNNVVGANVAYVPGIDAQGRPVVPAQGAGQTLYQPPENVTFDIEVDPRDYLGGPERDARVAAAAAALAAAETVTQTKQTLEPVTTGEKVTTGGQAETSGQKHLSGSADSVARTPTGLRPDLTPNQNTSPRVAKAGQELLAATRAASRRNHPLGPIRLGAVAVDLSSGQVDIDGQEVSTMAGPCGVVPSVGGSSSNKPARPQ